MLCRKCNTSLPNSSRKCSYCGAKASNQKGSAVIALSILVAFIASGSVYTHFEKLEKEQKYELHELEELLDQEPNIAKDITPDLELDTNVQVPEENNEVNRPLERNNMLTHIFQKANAYYAILSEQDTFVARNGYLYNASQDGYVTVSNLIDYGLLESEYGDEEVLILYMRPSNIERFLGQQSNTDKALQLYIAYENGDGFIFAFSESSFKSVSREDFYDLLALYAYEHGDISNEDHYNIINVISSYELEEYGVMHLEHDERFAVVQLSSSKIFVLEKIDNSWSMILSDIEAFSNPKRFINERIPNLNIDLIPN